MSLYESTFVVRQDISAVEVKKITGNFVAIIEKGKGKLLKEENWGLRNLAYKIKKNRKGNYVFLVFEASAEILKELNYRYMMNESVIRYMTIKIDKFKDEPTPMMAESESD